MKFEELTPSDKKETESQTLCGMSRAIYPQGVLPQRDQKPPAGQAARLRGYLYYESHAPGMADTGLCLQWEDVILLLR